MTVAAHNSVHSLVLRGKPDHLDNAIGVLPHRLLCCLENGSRSILNSCLFSKFQSWRFQSTTQFTACYSKENRITYTMRLSWCGLGFFVAWNVALRMFSNYVFPESLIHDCFRVQLSSLPGTQRETASPMRCDSGAAASAAVLLGIWLSECCKIMSVFKF